MAVPIIGYIVVGGALNKWRAHRKYQKANEISSHAIERVAKAEVKVEQHTQKASASLSKLIARTDSSINILQGQYADIFRPFENESGTIRETLMEDILGSNAVKNLAAIQSIQSQPQLKQLPAHKKQSGTSAAISFLLFGWAGEANRQLDTAETQSEVSHLIAAQADTICMAIDTQTEGYARVNQVLGALNAALLVSIREYNKYAAGFSFLIDPQTGRFMEGADADAISQALTPTGNSHLKNCANIAKCLYSILEKPIFNQNAELTEQTSKLLEEGEQALTQIQEIGRRKP